jgi:hypothetical protein
MKVIDRSEFRDDKGAISLENRLKGSLRYGTSWYADMESQETVTLRLGKILGSDFTLLRNITIPGLAEVIPMILIGPQGMRVIRPTSLRGVFRAKGDDWLRFEGSRFKKARPNIQRSVLDMANVVLHFVQAQGFGLPEVEAVLVFTNTRTHVDTAHPQARIIHADAIEHFASSLLEFQPIMDGEDVQILAVAIQHPRSEEPEPAPAPEPPPAPPPSMAPVPTGPSPLAPTGKVRVPPRPRPRRRGGLSRGQWIAIAALLVLELLVVLAMAWVIISGVV